ncbi:hypothetical protein PDJAM_G00266510 [Pangasius djambal]|nr:hypothetical protein [Pangasius djambal]
MAMTSDLTHTASSEGQDDVWYSNINFTHSHMKEVPIYSTAQLPKMLNQEEEVEYAVVNLPNPRAVQKEEIYRNLEFNECKKSDDRPDARFFSL